LYKDQGVDFFASQVTLGKEGVEKIHPVGDLDASEQKLIEACLPELAKNIKKVRRRITPFKDICG
jgi:malate dehydrogenase